jgi:hypothetical protein
MFLIQCAGERCAHIPVWLRISVSKKKLNLSNPKLALRRRLGILRSEALCQLYVFRHDRDAARMDGTEVGVLEEVDDVALGCLLHGEDGAGLEAEALIAPHGDLADQALEREFSEQHVMPFLILVNFAEGDGAGAEFMRLLLLRYSLLCFVFFLRPLFFMFFLLGFRREGGGASRDYVCFTPGTRHVLIWCKRFVCLVSVVHYMLIIAHASRHPGGDAEVFDS